MEQWVALTIAAVLVRGFYSISSKLVTDNVKLKSTTLGVLLGIFAATFSLLAAPFLGGLDLSGARELWWVAILLAASQGFGNVIYYKGQKHLDSGTTQVVLSSKLALTAVLAALFLGSSFTVVQVFGMILLTGSILLVQKNIKIRRLLDRGSWFIFMSAFMFSVFSISGAKLSDSLSPAGYLVIVYTGAAIAAFLFSPREVLTDLKTIRSQVKSVSIYMGFSAAVSTLYFALVYYAYIEASDSGLVAVLINAQVISTIFIAAIVLRERDNIRRKFFAGVLVVLASWLIIGF